MFPSVLTAKRSAPLQGGWIGCWPQDLSHLLLPGRQAPSHRSCLCRSPQPKAARQDTGAINEAAQAPAAPQPWILSSSQVGDLQSHLCL